MFKSNGSKRNLIIAGALGGFYLLRKVFSPTDYDNISYNAKKFRRAINHENFQLDYSDEFIKQLFANQTNTQNNNELSKADYKIVSLAKYLDLSINGIQQIDSNYLENYRLIQSIVNKKNAKNNDLSEANDFIIKMRALKEKNESNQEKLNELKTFNSKIEQDLHTEKDSFRKMLLKALNSNEVNQNKQLKENLQYFYDNYTIQLQKFHIDLDELEDENTRDIKVRESFEQLLKNKQNFKEKENEIVQNSLKGINQDLVDQYNKIKELNSTFTKNSNNINQLLTNRTAIQNEISYYNNVLQNFNKMEIDLNESNENVLFDQLNLKDQRILDYFNKLNPKQNLFEFLILFEADPLLFIIKDIYLDKSKELLSLIHYLEDKTKQAKSYFSKDYISVYLKQISFKLYALSNQVGDTFTSKMIETSKALNPDLASIKQLDHLLKDVKKEIFFEVLLRKDNVKDKANILSFMLSYLFDYTIPIWSFFLSPVFCSFKEDSDPNSKLVKLKAISYVNYYAKNNNIIDAYSYLKYLESYPEIINPLKQKLENLTKLELYIDLLENHFNI